jgi:hypothetical protein
MKKMPHTQTVLRSRMAHLRLKIATGIAGMLGPFILVGERGDQQRSAWDLVWRKCLIVV